MSALWSNLTTPRPRLQDGGVFVFQEDFFVIVIQCVDNRNGTLFHGRRQSRDRLLRLHILAALAGRKLWMNSYSFRQFQQDLPPGQAVCVDEDFLAKAGWGEVCFVEGLPLTPWLNRIEQLILYRWNRDYPADTVLDLRLDAIFWVLKCREEFPGSSHPVITKEVYLHETL